MEKKSQQLLHNQVWKCSISNFIWELDSSSLAPVKNYGATLDASLPFVSHNISKVVYWPLTNITTNKNMLTPDNIKKLVHAFITSRLD